MQHEGGSEVMKREGGGGEQTEEVGWLLYSFVWMNIFIYQNSANVWYWWIDLIKLHTVLYVVKKTKEQVG